MVRDYIFKIKYLLFICIATVTCSSVANSNLKPNIKNSVVSVISIKNNLKLRRGTAFYIGEGYFVTNFHVIVNINNDTLPSNNIYIDSLNNNTIFFIAKIMYLDAMNDLAVIQIDPSNITTLEKTITPLEIVENTTLKKNAEYKIISINYHSHNMLKHTEIKLLPKDIYKNSINTKNTELKFLSQNITHGMSGAPLLMDNKVIGILYATSDVFGFATFSSQLLKLLRKTPLDCVNTSCIKQEIHNLHTEAVNNNNPHAQYKLGLMYYVEKDYLRYIKAMHWLKLAAQQGHIQAQNNLYLMYTLKLGVPESLLSQPYYWILEKIVQNNIRSLVSHNN